MIDHTGSRIGRLAAAFALSGLLLAGVLGLSPGSRDHQIDRDGSDDAHRERLDALEMHPLPEEFWERLGPWASEARLDAEAVEERVLVVLVWSALRSEDVRVVPTMNRLGRTFEEDDVRLLAIHRAHGWEDALARAERGLISFPMAQDAEEEIVESLEAGEEATIYIVDRAGHVRFAGVRPAAALRAVRLLVDETPEQARLAGEHRQPAQARGPRVTRRTGAPDARPGVPAPTAGDYAEAAWPDHNPEGSVRAVHNLQGRPLPVGLGNEVWLTPRNRNPAEHVLVLDFWAVWCGPCRAVAPKLDQLQTEFRDELMILAISGQQENQARIRDYLRTVNYSFSFLHDDRQTLHRAIGVRAIPHVLILSTDGVVRWQGNPTGSRFEPALRRIVEADPGLAHLRRLRGAGDD